MKKGEADSIEYYLFEELQKWYKNDPAFCAGIALRLDELGVTGDNLLLAAFQGEAVDVRAGSRGGGGYRVERTFFLNQ